jgi:pimeloyl-ACP methyl ester carboxylesterase
VKLTRGAFALDFRLQTSGVSQKQDHALVKQIRLILSLAVLIFILAVTALRQGANSAAAASAPQTQQTQPPAPRVVDLKAADGTILNASYFAAAESGQGVLLLHQFNRTRDSWDGVARQLEAAGINTLTVDSRGHGESGGKYDYWTNPNQEQAKQDLAADLEATFQYLVLQPAVKRDVIGLGGAGLLGVDNSVRTARQHSAEVKSLALLSGETFPLSREICRSRCRRGRFARRH